ncbi:hypothetical protein [Streptomyces africanus]|uniref:hypothetical protein n=1 Tax=Streptomyces africanus TaxID=231024 RepID=UPI000A36FF43|nr:hypothetical protein [Streptomyces africanus]
MPLPPGHTTDDFLLMVVVTDDDAAPSLSSNWLYLGKADAGSSTSTLAKVQTRVYYRRDTGALGSYVTVDFNTSPWPAGSPYVLAFIAAYTGVDTAGPIEKWGAVGTANTAATQVHPQLTTVVSGDWLLTLRTGSAWQARTVTVTGGTNTERVDDTDGFGELFAALYDSGAALNPGAQTQRSTTSAGGDAVCQGGSTMWSLALKPVTAAAATVALPGTASVTATAYNPAVATAPGGWELCGEQGLPRYRVGIDWNADGIPEGVEELADTWATDSFSRTATDGWGTADSGQAWATDGGLVSDYAVSSGTGRHLHATNNVTRYTLLPSDREDVDLAVDFSMDQRPAAAGQVHYVFLFAREASGSFYYARLQIPSGEDLTSLSLRKIVAGGNEPALATAYPMTLSPGTSYRFRFRLTGQTLRAKVWNPSGAEPDWQATATASSGSLLTDAGRVGVISYTSSSALPVTFSFDNFRASDPADPEDVTEDIISEISITYGRDQERQLSPAAVGSAALTLNNSTRKYSPENTASPLYGDLDPARLMRTSVDFNGQTTDLFNGRIDDYNVHADYADRTAEFTFLDALNDLSGIKLSTGVYASMRTGELVNTILDLAGWTAGRDIDQGATVVRYWWAEGADALSAINDLVKSEGPPAVAYVAPDGTFTFRDRHHRLLRTQSRETRATFTGGRLEDCTAGAPAATGYDFTKPFTYSHGWRDIVNAVTFDVEERTPAASLEAVWTDESTYALAAGQSVQIEVTSSDPFVDAVIPLSGTDITYSASGAAWVWALLSRRSGASATLTLRAVGGPVTVTAVQLRARPLAVQRTVKVSLTDPGSVTRHGERSYPDSAPWAGPEDAEAIANMILLHYGHRRPTVQLRVTSQDPAHFMQVLQRTVSDRIRIVNEEMGLDSDFFVERVTHTIQRTGQPGRAPVHSVVLGCERDLVTPSNVFTFDVRGAGFDQGVFDLTVADAPGEVFVFDDPVQGQFDRGRLGT